MDLNTPKIIIPPVVYSHASYNNVRYFRPNEKNKEPKQWENNFKNVPTDGFVIDVSEYQNEYGFYSKYDYCSLQQDVDITDPRGNKFSISVRNLLMIMNYYNIIDNKINGELVYSWNISRGLCLLPVKHPWYNESKQICDILFNTEEKPTLKTLIKGVTYTLYNKEGDFTYLGALDWYYYHVSIAPEDMDKFDKYKIDNTDCDMVYTNKKYHTFVNTETKQFVKITASSELVTTINYNIIDINEWIETFKNNTFTGSKIVSCRFIGNKENNSASYRPKCWRNDEFGFVQCDDKLFYKYCQNNPREDRNPYLSQEFEFIDGLNKIHIKKLDIKRDYVGPSYKEGDRWWCGEEYNAKGWRFYGNYKKVEHKDVPKYTLEFVHESGLVTNLSRDLCILEKHSSKTYLLVPEQYSIYHGVYPVPQ